MEGAKNDIKTAQRAAPAERRRGRRLTLDEMLAIAAHFQRRGDAVGRQAHAVFTVLVGLQSRGNEVLDGGLRIGDVVFGTDALEAGTVLSKTHQTETTMQPKAAIHGRAEHAILCASRALRHHWMCDSSWEPAWGADSVRRQWPAFGTLDRLRRITATPLKMTTFMNNLLKPAMHAIGIEPGNVDAHVGRYAGENYHEITLGLSWELTEVLGGWSPTSTLGNHYADKSANELAALGAKAFAERNPGAVRCCTSPP